MLVIHIRPVRQRVHVWVLRVRLGEQQAVEQGDRRGRRDLDELRDAVQGREPLVRVIKLQEKER